MYRKKGEYVSSVLVASCFGFHKLLRNGVKQLMITKILNKEEGIFANIAQRGIYDEAYFFCFLNAVVTISNSKNATS